MAIDAIVAIRGVIGQANVEEAGILLRDKLVHVVLRRSNKEHIVSSKIHELASLCLNTLLGFEGLEVLIVDEVVVSVLLVNLVV